MNMHVHKTEKTKKYIEESHNLSHSLTPSHSYFFTGYSNYTQVLVLPPKDIILL